MSPILEVNDVSKKFARDLRSGIKLGLQDVARRAVRAQPSHELRAGEFWAVRNVSFSLNAGESLGLLGANGSGKTTLLKMINGGMLPTRGNIRIRGSVGALIALGAGTSPNLTGLENIHLLCAIAGVSRKLSQGLIDDIVDFSGLGSDIDRPLRNYSSGMTIRLGFSVAVATSPSLLLVDEVLAVGDVAFQKRCVQRVRQLRAQGTALLLVSHSVHALWSMCDEGVVLEKALASDRLPIETAIQRYELISQSARSEKAEIDSIDGVLRVNLKNSKGELTTNFAGTEPVDFCIELTTRKPIAQCSVRLVVGSQAHPHLFVLDSFEQSGSLIEVPEGTFRCSFHLKDLGLRTGEYRVDAGVVSREDLGHVVAVRDAHVFNVVPDEHRFEIADDRAAIRVRSVFRVHLS